MLLLRNFLVNSNNSIPVHVIAEMRRSPHNDVSVVPWPQSKQVRTLFALSCSLSDQKLRKGMNPFILPDIGKIVSLLHFSMDDFDIK